MFKNSSAPQLNFTLIGVALELTIKLNIRTNIIIMFKYFVLVYLDI
ncbi:hypothetical protein HYD86_02100 [Mycoplasmopsis bovis]|nr:hypothetical protein HYD86_02100 [Mycoplasmopsis bovis]